MKNSLIKGINKKLSRAKRKIQKKKLLKEKQRLETQPPMTQDQIDDLFKQLYQKKIEKDAKDNIEAQNEAFDNFVTTGKVVPPENFKKLEKFLTKARIGQFQLPDIDLDEENTTLLTTHLKSRENNDE